jgi:hypothetical protein
VALFAARKKNVDDELGVQVAQGPIFVVVQESGSQRR